MSGFGSAMSKLRPLYLRNVVSDLISETRGKRIRNLMNNYFIRIHMKLLFSYVLLTKRHTFRTKI